MNDSVVTIPFSYEERRPILLDRYFFVPNHYEKHQLSGYRFFSSHNFFEKDQSIHIEFCSGNGSWIFEKALKNPHINYVAVEMRFDRAKKILKRVLKADMKNLLIIHGEAKCFVENYVENNTLSFAFINFPDPWPKKRHAKHRLITEEFMEILSKKMIPNSCIIMVTDDEDTSKRMIEKTLFHPFWKADFKEPYFVHQLDGYGDSFFRNLWEEKGKKIFFMKFSNVK